MRTIYLAGGCFWGVEAYFKALDGILDSTVGYANGWVQNPSYDLVCGGQSGHVECLELRYDENKLSLRDILRHFFRIIDPYSLNRQGNDIGPQYRSGIYWSEAADEACVRPFLAEMQAAAQRPLRVEAQALRCFYPAEDYHQDYLQKNPGGYCHIDLQLSQKAL